MGGAVDEHVSIAEGEAGDAVVVEQSYLIKADIEKSTVEEE